MYYLILDNGYQLEFHVRSCAEVFQQVYGGRIVYSEQELLAA